MNLQSLYLASKELSEVFSKQFNTTLLTDETSKFRSKYMGYAAADADRNLRVIGIRGRETKSADNTS